MSNKPTLLFIPGAWHLPTCYNKIITILEKQHDFECDSITLPSTTGSAEATFKDDLDTARDAITKHISRGRDVVVVAHSYGGMLANSAIKDFTSSGTSPEPKAHVTGLILIASGFTLTGLSFMDPLFHRPPPTWHANRNSGFAELVVPPSSLFYHDIPNSEAQYHSSQLRPQSLKALFEGGEYAYSGWRDVAWCLYIGTLQDRGLPVFLQRMQIGMARAMGAKSVWHVEVNSSHSPFLSRPEEVVGVICAAIEGGGTGDAEVLKMGREVWAPRVRLGSPGSWFQYGVPLAFGMVIGKAVLIFEWCKKVWAR
ncbi:alpha/beta-hydrolase [Periconia macrospinosa]|uniref:Alpha/beta-hydrolase n=1 Tax=Periconia macrospinosa TaxID=97972 RepID=A0A2V1E2G7_9PLEO|nr:alpha/beta-hydrolase [Periconia macrospinosa]